MNSLYRFSQSFLLGSIFILFSGNLQSQITQRIYLIGNSVTDAINYGGFEAIALSRGNTHIWGRSMTPGAPLENLWKNEPSFSQAPYGGHSTALVNYSWDALTLQPFDRNLYGANGDLEMCLNFINEAKSKSPELQTYIYSRWPRAPYSKGPSDPSLTAEVWEKCWLGTYSSFQSNETKKYFNDLTDTLRGINTGLKPVCMIPVGDVFNELNKKMKSGQVPGLTRIWDVYSDGIHLKGTGSFIAAVTFYATIYKQDPRGLEVPQQFGSISPAVAEMICQTVYEVVFTHPLSGTSLDDLIPVSGVSLSANEIELPVLNSVDLVAAIQPENAANKKVYWSSGNTGIAVVDNKGRVTGLSAGTAPIIVRSSDGDFRDTCLVHVTGSIPGTVKSGVIAAWDFKGIAGADSVPATSRMEGIRSGKTSGIASLGAGLGKSTYVGNGLYAVNQNTLNLTSALAGNEYFSFVLEPEKGRMISIDTIQLVLINQNNPRYFTLMSSVKGFDQNGILDSVRVTEWITRRTAVLSNHSNLPGKVELRCYVYGYNNAYESVGFGLEQGYHVIIKGSVFTPSDNEKPSVPGLLEASQVKAESLSLSWGESTDNLVVWGYNVYRDGQKINDELLKERIYNVSGLKEATTYDFTVTAVDFLGNESEPALLSVLTNRRPVAKILANIENGEAPLTVQFSSETSTDPDEGDFILGFSWDFGDKSPVDLSNSPVHTFQNPGSYHVILRVVDNRELYSFPDTLIIEVSEPSQNINAKSSSWIQMYPNPAGNITRLEGTHDFLNDIERIECFSLDGRKMMNISISGDLLDLSKLPRGNYLILIETRYRRCFARLSKI